MGHARGGLPASEGLRRPACKPACRALGIWGCSDADLVVAAGCRLLRVRILDPPSPLLHRVSYLVGKKADLDEALIALMSIRELKQLELIVRNFVLTPDELRVIGEQRADGGGAPVRDCRRLTLLCVPCL